MLCLACRKTWVRSPTPHKPGMLVFVCNPSPGKVEAGSSEFQGDQMMPNEFEGSLGYSASNKQKGKTKALFPRLATAAGMGGERLRKDPFTRACFCPPQCDHLLGCTHKTFGSQLNVSWFWNLPDSLHLSYFATPRVHVYPTFPLTRVQALRGLGFCFESLLGTSPMLDQRPARTKSTL